MNSFLGKDLFCEKAVFEYKPTKAIITTSEKILVFIFVFPFYWFYLNLRHTNLFFGLKNIFT